MRFLDTRTLEFHDIVRPARTNYAILSHTWGDEEVSLQDFQKPESKQLQGYKKIEQCCAQAHHDGYDYVWIDTCCIDKTSSAELSEAINSMYNCTTGISGQPNAMSTSATSRLMLWTS